MQKIKRNVNQEGSLGSPEDLSGSSRSLASPKRKQLSVNQTLPLKKRDFDMPGPENLLHSERIG